MKHIFTILLFIGIIQSTNAQRPPGGGGRGGWDPSQMPDIEIKGQVLDEATQEGLEFATIAIYSKKDSSVTGGAITDMEGKFVVKTKPGKLYAVVEFLGYEKQVVDPIPIDREKMKSGDRSVDLGTIVLNASGVLMEEVEIRAEKSETQFSLDKKVFNVGKDLANKGGTAEEILDNVPSVTVDVEGNVSLRGREGVRILIDGKPSGLTTGETSSLRQIPANMIDKVEVITNPSARYEAEGMAGIINVVLKKDKRSGFNGSFDVTGGLPAVAGLGANLNYRKGKINWFANYGLNYQRGPGGGSLFRETQLGDAIQYLDQNRDMERGGLNNTFRFGMDYYFKEKESLTGAFQYRFSDEDNFATMTYKDYLGTPSNLIQSSIRTDDEIEEESALQYSLNYRKEFSNREHTLNASIQYEDELETEGSTLIEDVTDVKTNSVSQINQRSNNSEGTKTWLFQVDYVKPLGKKDHKYELGARTTLREVSNDYLVEEQNAEGEWFNLEGLSNDFLYDEKIYAAYGQYGNRFGKFSFQVGLRAEYTDIKTELLQTNEENYIDTLNFFPSVFLNYEFKEGNSLQTSYSRRVRRPGFWELNPFFTFSDRRNFFSGNPNLKPEFTDSYEINYLRFWDKATFSGGIYYRHTKGVIQRLKTFRVDTLYVPEVEQLLIDTIIVTGVTQPENLTTADDFGFDFNISYSGIKWLRLDWNLNMFRSITDGTNFDSSFEADTYTWTSRLTSRITFWKDANLQIRGNYRAPRETTQGKRKSILSVDLGVSKDFLPSKNLTATISVRDLFNSRKRRYEVFGPNFYEEGDFQWRARMASLTLSYRVNQKKKWGRKGGGGYPGGGDSGGF